MRWQEEKARVVSPQAIRADANMTVHAHTRARVVSAGPGVKAHNITWNKKKLIPSSILRPQHQQEGHPQAFSAGKIRGAQQLQRDYDNETAITYYLPRARARALPSPLPHTHTHIRVL